MPTCSNRLLSLPQSDPRSYVKPQPLPIPAQKGVRIQARSQLVYHATEPQRHVVRQQNYERRSHQQQHQGFWSRPDRPYEGLGDPLYLDPKQLILHSLGQWEEGQQLDSASSSDCEADVALTLEDKKAGGPPNFVLRGTKKGLKTLNKEMTRQRELIRNVSLGHGFFQQLQKEREDETAARRQEAETRRRQQLSDWRPARADSPSDDSDDDDDVDLQEYMAEVPERPLTDDHKSARLHDDMTSHTEESLPDQSKGRVVFVGDPEVQSAPPLTLTSARARSECSRRWASRASRASSRRKAPLRPYTPQHSCIGTDLYDTPDTSALFRQLCSLYWLLEAMNLESPVAMESISKSWNLREIGGQKTTTMKLQVEKRNDTRWKQFVSNQSARAGGPGRSVRRGTAQHRVRGAGARRASGDSTALLPSVTSTPSGTARGHRVTVIPEGSQVSNEQETATDVTEEEDLGRGPLRYLDEFYDREQSALDPASQRDKQSALSDRSSCSPPAGRPHQGPPPQPRDDPRRFGAPPEGGSTSPTGGTRADAPEPPPSQQDILRFLESITRSAEDPRFHALAHPREKRSARDMRADLAVRPRLTPAVLEYVASLPSTRVGGLARDQRQRFLEMKQEKALTLHEEIELKSRQRLRVLQNKFAHLPLGGCSLHRALGAMRCRSARDEEQREQRRDSTTTHQTWYIDLISNVSEAMKKEWFFQVILDKLNKYGLADSPKQSAYKLVKVLAGLRDWEICSPDVSAAIEFCRDRICEMTIDDYEQWFQASFPAVLRPHTAPAAPRGGPAGEPSGGPAGGRASRPASGPAGGPPGGPAGGPAGEPQDCAPAAPRSAPPV